MAEVLIGAVTEVVLSKVISLANDQISAVLGVKEDLRSLAKQLELIHALLSDAETRSTTNKAVGVWLQELEDAATEADDLLDDFAYEVVSKKMQKGKKDKVRSFFSSSNPLVFRSEMVSKIKKIKFQMNEIFETASQIGLRPAEIINSPTDPTRVLLTDPFVDDSQIVGRGDDLSEIVSQLTCSKDEKNLSVIGIVGMGGQGKTTLAQLLLKNDEVKKYFEKRVWTCVSDDFNVDRVLKDMLQSLTGEASQLTNREAIVERLSKELQRKRFLLVLDDVWSEDSQLWNFMNNSLQAIGGSKGSKIIVTTRNEVVVTIMNGSVYRLGLLSQKDSKELFENMAFGNGRVAKTPQLVEIGERIVARCGGVPLALKAIGSLMSSRGDELEWLKIEESNIWSTLDVVHSAIKLSFNHLPSLSSKQCFVYCSIFPKDSVIDKNDTIQQWMAHGFLNPSSGSDLEMEDIGNNYFKILLQRSLLQEAEFDKHGNIKSCKMHDLVHDFALETSKGHCLSARVGELSDAVKAAHLSIVPGGSNNLNISEKNFSRLRTLHLSEDFSSHNFLVLCKCKYLRVLTMSGEEMEELPISIAKMKHLRYLDISGTSICEVPEFISKLYNLQTLKLPFGSNLPKDFVRLVNLRHLRINKELSLFGGFMGGDPSPAMVPGISQLNCLRTLSCFGVSRDKGCQIEELCSLNHLEGSLRIIGLENVANGDDASRANLLGKRNIESLELVWSDNNTEESSDDESVLKFLQPHPCLKALKIENFMGRSVPSWMPLLRNLTRMKLYDLKNCEQIPALGHLQFLRILHIINMSSIKCIGNDFYGWPNPNVVRANSSQTSAVVFPSLKELKFVGMRSLEVWSVVSSSSVELFPSLETLHISRCPCLSCLPEGLLSASIGLVSLVVRDCYKLVSIPDLSIYQSLKDVYIFYCPELLSWPHGIEACKSIQQLTITCPVSAMGSLLHSLFNLRKLSDLTLELSNDIIDHYVATEPISNIIEDDHFSTLEGLTLIGMPQIKSLPEQIQCLTALRNLTLNTFEGLESLPEWLSNFRSLETLYMWNCDSLANFPSVEVMQGLTNLKHLATDRCPNLKQRCERETGAEWHKIAHIPKIDIDWFSD